MRNSQVIEKAFENVWAEEGDGVCCGPTVSGAGEAKQILFNELKRKDLVLEKALRALKGFGKHDTGCPAIYPKDISTTTCPCTCGFEYAFRVLRESIE